MEFLIMARIKSGEPIRSERLLMALGNGGIISLQEIADTMNYHNMYRISAEVYCLKLNGCVIKSHKTGRKVSGYELVNTQEAIDKLLTPRGLSIVPIVGRDAGISKLADLKAKTENKIPEVPVIVEDEVVEITE
jgi:biotin operon repressor